LLGERCELRAEHRFAGDPDLLRDLRAGHNVVTGDHPHADVRPLRVLDRRPRLGGSLGMLL
jgi:hypothetical protein